MNTLQKKDYRWETDQKIDYRDYIDNLPFEAFILKVVAKSPTEGSGEGFINKGGTLSFRVGCSLDLVYTEEGDKHGFSYSKSTTDLLEILDSKGKTISYSESEDIIIRNLLNHKIVFSIKKDF